MQTITEAIETNDKRTILEAMRNKVAAKIDTTSSARDLVPLTRHLMQIMDEIDALSDADPDDPISQARHHVAEYRA